MGRIRALYALFWLNFKRIYQALPGFLRKKCLLAFAGMAVLAFFEVATMFSISFLGMSIAAPEAALSFGFMRHLNTYPTAKQIFADPRNIAMFGSAFVVGLISIKNLVTYLMQYWTIYFGELIALNIGERLFGNYLHRDYIDFLAGKSGYIHYIIGLRSHVGQYMVTCMNVYTYLVAFLALVFLVLSQTPVLAFCTLVLVGITSILVYGSVRRGIDRESRQAMQYSWQEGESLSNAFGGIREIIIYQQQNTFLDIFRKNAEAKIKPQSFLSVSVSIPSLVLETMGFVSIPCMVATLVYWYRSPMAEIASSLTMLLLFCWRVLPMLNRSLSYLVSMRALQTTAFTCLDEVEKLEEYAAPQSVSGGGVFHITEKIALDEVSFTYPGKALPALSGITCDAPLGRRVGIVGLSGAGKSTLAGVLSGLLAPNGGRMLVDGRPLTAEDLSGYRKRVGYVPQSAFVMNGTLAQNIAFSEWGRPIDEQKVWRAAELAALDFIRYSPQGIDMPLSSGSGLSGGQMQRVSIARALYVSPRVLILDESTSSLDLATERAVLQTIENLPGDLIVFVIAHRLSTVEYCDEIWWLEQGGLRRRGPVAEVLPEYAEYLACGKAFPA